MDVDDEKVSTLMGMGFMDVEEIHRALKMSNNDINEAVSHLFREQPGFSNPGNSEFGDVEIKSLKSGKTRELSVSSDLDARVPNVDGDTGEQDMDVGSLATKVCIGIFV